MNTIKIFENDVTKEYKVLLVIDKDYKYVIYTDKDNYQPDKNLMVAKVKSINEMNESLPITDDEWKMIEDNYQKILNSVKN